MSNEHNNAPAVPQGEPVAWMVTNGGPHSLYFSRMYADDAVWMAKNVCYKKSIPNDFQIHPLYSSPAPAPAVPQGAFLSITEGRIKEIASRFGAVRNAVSFAREIEHEFRALLAATPAPAPAQEAPSDPNGWCQYVAGMVFCWLQMQEGLGLTSYDEDRFVEAIAGIVQRRLWAYKPAQEVSDKHEREMLEVIDERDRINEWADQLADAISKHTGYEIGEHTSANNPWRMALNALVRHEAKQEVGLTDEALENLIEDLSEWSRHVVEDTAHQTLEAHVREVLAKSAIIAALRAKGSK